MELSFQHPSLLAGLALLALPVLAHLAGRRPLAQVPFPAVRFLLAAQRSLRRRWLVDDLLLLLLRMLVVASIVALFARPEITREVSVAAGAATAVDTVVVVDRSLSTGASLDDGAVFDRIVSRAADILGGLEPGTRAALVWMDHRARLEGNGLVRDPSVLVEALDGARPGHGATDLDGALALALDVLLRDGVPEGQVLVLGDGTATGLPAPSLAEVWPPGVALRYLDLSGDPPDNRWVDEVVQPAATELGAGVPVEVRVAGAPSDGTPVDLHVEGMEVIRGSVSLVEGETATKRFSVVAPPAGQVPAAAHLGGDALPGDDLHPFFLRASGHRLVYLLGGEGGASARDEELYYLSTALQPATAVDGGLEPVRVDTGELAELPAGPGTVLLACNVPASPELADGVRRLLDAGGGVLLSAGSLVDRDAYGAALGDLLPAPLGAVKSREETTFEATAVALAPPDLLEPLWAPFREGGLSTFGRVRFDRVLEVEPFLAADSRVLLRYSDGRAALLERRVGDGRLLLFTSTLDDDWTDLPVRGIFLPMVHQLVRYLAGELERTPTRVVTVGDRPRIDLDGEGPGGGGGEALTLVEPSGRVRPVGAGLGPRVLPEAEAPGHYQLTVPAADGDAPRIVARYCARVDAAESALVPLDRVALGELFPDLVHVREQPGAEEGAGSRATVVRRSSLVPALAWWIVALLGLEAWKGGRR